MSPENPLNPDQLLIQTPIEAAYLFVCLLLCLSTSLSFSPSFCPSFDPSVHMPASFLVWVARHTIIIGGTTYTTVQQYQAWILMFQAVRSKLPPSSPASPPVADTTLPPEKEKKLRNLKKVKYHFIPQPTQENTKSLKCVLCCQLIKKNTFNKKIWTNTSPKMGINQSIIGDFHIRHNNFIMLINIVYLSKFTYK